MIHARHLFRTHRTNKQLFLFRSGSRHRPERESKNWKLMIWGCVWDRTRTMTKWPKENLDSYVWLQVLILLVSPDHYRGPHDQRFSKSSQHIPRLTGSFGDQSLPCQYNYRAKCVKCCSGLIWFGGSGTVQTRHVIFSWRSFISLTYSTSSIINTSSTPFTHQYAT